MGGGTSFRRFPTFVLKNKNVIGCNTAYTLGEDVVDLVFFGDEKWWNYHRANLQQFKNPIITNHPNLKDVSGVTWCPRSKDGFHRHSIGWNGNTGAAAINLALLLGAQRILLLGYDMELDPDGGSNWYPTTYTPATAEHYQLYSQSLEKHVCDIEQKWPNVSILNLNPQSKLEVFEKCYWNDIFFGQ